MKITDRIRIAASVLSGKTAAGPSWNWRGGTKSGHVFDGSKFKGSLFYPSKWDLDHEAIREKSRLTYWESSQARAIIGRLAENVVGTGLALEYRPIWSLIGDQGMSEEEKHKFVRDVELRFDLYASSKESDAAGRHTLYEKQLYEYINRLRDGETIQVLRYSGDASRMSPLMIQDIMPEQVATPTDKISLEVTKTTGRRIENGIELDAYGRELAIHIFDDATRTSTRVPVYGPSGRRFVLHPLNTDTLGSVRGTSILAPMIHELQKITDGTVAELEAMVLNAILAVFVTPSQNANSSRPLDGIKTRGPGEPKSDREEGGASETVFDKPGLIIQNLKAGETIDSFDSKRPNVNFPEFVRQITKILSASCGLPIEVLEESFNQNYSASRASLLLFWEKVEIERSKTASQFLAPIFEAWFIEEVIAGRIKAGNFNNGSPVIRRAWLSCAWNGDKQPSIDPLKEANADRIRIEDGITTRERVAMEFNGSDYSENVRRLTQENVELAAANKPLEKAVAPAQNPVNPIDEEDDGEKSNSDKKDGSDGDQ